MFPRLLMVIFLSLTGLLCAVSIAYVSSNLGYLPDYGDSATYLRAAVAGEPDPYHAPLYSQFLKRVETLVPGTSLLKLTGRGPQQLRWAAQQREQFSSKLAGIQIAQLLLCAIATLYFLHGWLGTHHPRSTILLLGALLLFDPVIVHFNLCVMADALAYSGSLVFCGALARLTRKGSGKAVALLLLLTSHVLVANLRLEKNYVLIGTVALSLVAWTLLGRRAERRGEPRRMPQALAAVIAAVTLATGGLIAQATPERVKSTGSYSWERSEGWSLKATLLHQRIVFPHLRFVHDELPRELQEAIPLEAAQDHDLRIQSGRVALRRATQNQIEETEALITDLAAVVWRERWPHIVLDVANDTLAGALATPFFYAHLSVILLWGIDVDNWFYSHRSNNTARIYQRLSSRHTSLSAFYLGVSGLLFFFALVTTAVLWRRSRAPMQGQSVIASIPLLSFALLNAVVFASTQDLVQIRYSVLAHAMCLAFVFWAFNALLNREGERRRSP